MTNVFKIILVILLFLCLADMPYGYYQLVRFIALIGFAFLAFQAVQRNRQNELIIYACLALLFQPFFKVVLGREIWNTVDVVVGVFLLVSIFLKPNNTKEYYLKFHLLCICQDYLHIKHWKTAKAH